jgi:putative ABC transport system permease protein
MLHAAIRDLFHRRRRYLISIAGCGLVFAMSMVMTGLADSFAAEWKGAISAIGAESFLVPEGVGGPFTGTSPIEASELPAGSEPLVYATHTAVAGDDSHMISLFGVPRGSAFEPAVVSGHQLSAAGQVLVSERSPYLPGSTVTIRGQRLEVVGIVEDFSVNGGMFCFAVSGEDAQGIVFGGAELANAGLVAPGGGPIALDGASGLKALSAADAVEDAMRLLESARQSISFTRAMLWGVAALIVGSVTFLSVIERLRDFALFKAIGTSTKDIAIGVITQSSVVALGSSLLGVALGVLIAPTFPMPVTLSTLAMVGLPALGLFVGVVSSLFGLQRVLKVEPALAFGGMA